MEDRETPRMHKYGESKTAWIMITLRHVTSSSGLRKFQAAWFSLNRVYKWKRKGDGRFNTKNASLIESASQKYRKVRVLLPCLQQYCIWYILCSIHTESIDPLQLQIDSSGQNIFWRISPFAWQQCAWWAPTLQQRVLRDRLRVSHT